MSQVGIGGQKSWKVVGKDLVSTYYPGLRKIAEFNFPKFAAPVYNAFCRCLATFFLL